MLRLLGPPESLKSKPPVPKFSGMGLPLEGFDACCRRGRGNALGRPGNRASRLAICCPGSTPAANAGPRMADRVRAWPGFRQCGLARAAPVGTAAQPDRAGPGFDATNGHQSRAVTGAGLNLSHVLDKLGRVAEERAASAEEQPIRQTNSRLRPAAGDRYRPTAVSLSGTWAT